MDDLQVVRLLDVQDVKQLELAQGVTPVSVVITGQQAFTSVDQVLLNGVQSPEIVHYAANKILAQVPSLLVGTTLTDVFVLSNNLTFTKSSLVSLTLGSTPRTATGILRLMQMFTRLLLRSPGSNAFHPNSGGGMGAKIGTVFGGSGTVRSRIIAEAATSVMRTRQYIINVQTPNRNIPARERLLGADVVGVNADPRNGTLFMTVAITAHSGETAASTLTA